MLIGWQEGVAHRIAVGWIALKQWAQAEWHFKTISLE